MSTNLNEWLRQTRKDVVFPGHPEYDGQYIEVRKRIVCADGVSLSVQAGEMLYCEPRSNYGPYTSVEVGYPDVLPDGWQEWAEDDGIAATVFARVPVAVVEEFINQHGGMA